MTKIEPIVLRGSLVTPEKLSKAYSKLIILSDSDTFYARSWIGNCQYKRVNLGVDLGILLKIDKMYDRVIFHEYLFHSDCR
ncbi:hypothetical protein Cha6605_0898 [Chamaesiphon minutus PCC 6605]|uniref:Uncharacterized protein n=1 Tax=Chamaesiphon minutus (strain ATCC 27169 / PCC 6605) TaxID=1173020 RepID=K9UBZ5_CHAP6|nr:hypothetical protein Cha6605_0898 [Chamaesiphon minutus PCC 6605]